MLTGHKSTFQDTSGSVAWLYHCAKFLLPLRVLDKSCDWIPILFERTTKFVDPTIRQTYNYTSELTCLGDNTNVFQLDLKNDNSWYHLLTNSMPFIKPLLFTPTELGHITQFLILDTKRARMLTPNQIKSFWDVLIHASASNTVLMKMTRTILTQSNTI